MEPSSKGQTTMSADLGSQQLSSTNGPGFQTALPVSWGLQPLSSVDEQLTHAMVQTSLPVNLGPDQLFSMSKQSTHMESSQRSQTPVPVFLGLEQLSSSNRGLSGTDPLLNNQTSMAINLGSHSLSSTNKRPKQMAASSKIQNARPANQGSQQLSSKNKRPAQMELPQKVRSESFESVRLKLRESLAASLSMVSGQQNKEIAEKNSTLIEVASTTRKVEVATSLSASSSIISNASSYGTLSETLTSKESVQKHDEASLTNDTGSNEHTSDSTKIGKCDVQEFQLKHVTSDEVPIDNSVVKDELLQGHGLCWASDLDTGSTEAVPNHDSKRLKTAHDEVAGNKKDTTLQNAESLAFRIEAELFRLFGGVNKKYKEKARSLLFNLKDRSNPELRERVLSGDIAPERLCSMTAEELASKELSQWRLAKAEEFAQMVVLPDSEVDIRRMVKKTHKGEFQVEVEQADGVSVEVELGASMLSKIPAKTHEELQIHSRANDKISQNLSKPKESRASERVQSAEKVDSADKNPSGNLDTLSHEKTDLMQELMVDEIKDTELLPPIVSLDEFMMALDSEPPFENLSMETLQESPSSGEKNLDSLESETVPAPERLRPKQNAASDSLRSKSDSSKDGLGSKLGLAGTSLKDPMENTNNSHQDVDIKHTKTDNNSKYDSVDVQSDTCCAEIALTSENIWEGVIQLNISSLATVVGSFRSGEKTSTREWPSLLEIKGRVRLDAFEKFLQELPLSRSRAVMIVQFCWKDGSPESGRSSLSETTESYIADERVGFAEPAPGVELYCCPTHSRIIEMLGRCLPKEHAETLQSTVNGLIGVVVWRRPYVTASPRMSSHHKRSSTKKQSSSRKPQNVDSSSTPRSSIPSLPSGTPTNPAPPPDDDSFDDVPPGFGPGNAKDEDDLPEFDFVHGSLKDSEPIPSQPAGVAASRRHHMPHARPVDQMRELVYKYGQGEIVKKPSIEIQPWNDDDDDDEDDIPEWRPNRDNHPQVQAPLPPPPQLNVYPQQTGQSFQMNQHLASVPQQQLPPQPYTPPQQQLVSLAAPLPMPPQPSLQPQMGMVPGVLNAHSPWQQPNPWFSSARGPADVNLPVNGLMQPPLYGAPPSDAQFYGVPNLGAVQNGMGWRPDNPRSRRGV
ncbi:death-inducer obliterator 1-like [Phoenix dactylifera]|uniref:Death-inducer obliterator 1-like n=1 Tax=Phoenix dactylifera TaxID=42345 RepID=A0A8B7CYR9_PHODC|nr:death-inducer obliterator 1-like [Phoenix dactylifera]XP_008809015.2 death-inducer obliterator 1-like [Phoenix dactylifera]